MKPIETEEENERMLAIINDLMLKGEENLTPEAEARLDGLATAVEAFEKAHYMLSSPAPADGGKGDL